MSLLKMLLRKCTTRVRLKVILKGLSFSHIIKCNVCHKFPWLKFICMDALTIIMFSKSTINIVRYPYIFSGRSSERL